MKSFVSTLKNFARRSRTKFDLVLKSSHQALKKLNQTKSKKQALRKTFQNHCFCYPCKVCSLKFKAIVKTVAKFIDKPWPIGHHFEIWIARLNNCGLVKSGANCAVIKVELFLSRQKQFNLRPLLTYFIERARLMPPERCLLALPPVRNDLFKFTTHSLPKRVI